MLKKNQGGDDMFAKKSERMAIYLEEVGKYARVLCSLRGLETDEKSGKITHVDNSACFQQLSNMNIRLRAMEAVLGLNNKEIIAIHKKFGIELGDF